MSWALCARNKLRARQGARALVAGRSTESLDVMSPGVAIAIGTLISFVLGYWVTFTQAPEPGPLQAWVAFTVLVVPAILALALYRATRRHGPWLVLCVAWFPVSSLIGAALAISQLCRTGGCFL